MGDFDLFFLFRRILVLVCTVYGAVRLSHSVWRWHRFLSPARRSTNLARHYLFLHFLRVRLHRFTVELIQIVVLLVIFFGIVHLHRIAGQS